MSTIHSVSYQDFGYDTFLHTLSQGAVHVAPVSCLASLQIFIRDCLTLWTIMAIVKQTHTHSNGCVLIECNTVLISVELLSRLGDSALLFYRIVVTSLEKCHGARKTFILLFICFLFSSQNEPNGPTGLPVIHIGLEGNGQIQKELL